MLKQLKLLLLTTFLCICALTTVAYAKTPEKEITDGESFSLKSSDTRYGDEKDWTLATFKSSEEGYYDLTLDSDSFDENSNTAYLCFYKKDSKNELESVDIFGMKKGKIRYSNAVYLMKNTEYYVAASTTKSATGTVDGEEFIDGNYNYIIQKGANIENVSTEPVSVSQDEYNRKGFYYTATEDGLHAFKLEANKVNELKNFVLSIYEISTKENRRLFQDNLSPQQFVPGNHNAIDLKLKKGVKYLFEFDNTKYSNDDTLYNGSFSVSPCTLKDFKVEKAFDSFNGFEDIRYKDLNFTMSYTGEESSTFKSNLDQTSIICNDNWITNSSVLKPGKRSITCKYIDKTSKLTIDVTSAYDYAIKNGKEYRVDYTKFTDGTPILVGSEGRDEYYFKVTPEKTGLYWVTFEGCKDPTMAYSRFLGRMADKNNNVVKNEDGQGFYLTKGQTYAFYFLDTDYTDAKDDHNCEFLAYRTSHKCSKVVSKKAVAATYTHTGRTAEYKCKYCGKILVKSKTIAKKKLAKTSITKITKNKKNKNIITIKWKKVKDANRYFVYRYNAKTKKYVKIATLSAKKLSYTDKKFKFTKKIKTYSVKIVAGRMEGKKLVAKTSSNAKKIKK